LQKVRREVAYLVVDREVGLLRANGLAGTAFERRDIRESDVFIAFSVGIVSFSH
jgi:hypothetical protein